MTGGLRDGSRSLASVECRIKTVDKASPLEVDRLVQEADGTAVQRACLNRLVGIGRYEDDWYVKAEMRQVMLQLYAAHVWQMHIQYQTSRFGHYRRLQKRLGRRECAGCQSERPHEGLYGPANPIVVVYERYERSFSQQVLPSSVDKATGADTSRKR